MPDRPTRTATAAPAAVAGVAHAPAQRAAATLRGSIVRAAWSGLLAAAALAGATSCAAPEPLLLDRVPVAVRMQLAASGGGPAAQLAVRITLSTPESEPVQVLGIREDAARPEEASLLDLEVAWTDFKGDGPQSTGRSLRVVLPFVQDASMQAGAPLVVERLVELAPATGILARRVSVRARLIGFDLRQEQRHTGGTMMPLEDATLESFAEAPPGSLAQHLQSRSVAGIFLSAASASASRREEILAALIEALPATPEPARGAIFAALLYLTGETHGRDIYRWSTWWKERATRTGKGPAPPGPP